MKAFRLHTPKSMEQALALLDTGRDPKQRDRTKLLAGGQDLLTEMKEHLVEPEDLVNLKGVPGLDRIAIDAGGNVAIGALATIAAVEEDAGVRDRFRILHEAAASIASPQIRSQGTVGGNLCQRPRCWYYRSEHARCIKKGGSECFSYQGLNKYNAIFGGGPSYIVHPSDLAPALVAMGARVELRSSSGQRTVELEKFFTLPSEGSVVRENVLAPGGIVERVDVPAPESGMRSTYLKFKERGSYDFALVSVALALWLDGKTVRRARLVLGGVAPIPWRCAMAEKLLVGRALEPAMYDAAAAEALKGAEPLAHNGYKIPLAKGLIVRALQQLASA
jgi:xanthine dehydrogenase YagS FAD-binding subunit